MAAFEIIALDPVTPQLRAPEAGDTYSAPRPILMLDGSRTAPSLGFSTVANKGFYLNGSLLVFADSNADIWWTAASSFSMRNNAEFGWVAATTAGGSMDVVLVRDAANTLAQRNGTNAQTFRIYNTYTDASNYERGFMRWSSNVLQIGTEAAGTGVARNLDLQTSGVTRLSLSSAAATFSGNLIASSGGLTLAGGGFFNWSGRGSIYAVSDGVLTMVNNAGSAFGRLNLGGETSSFPAIKRSSAAAHIRLADDSAFADLVFRIPTTNPGPGTLWNNGGVLTIGT